LAREQRRLAAIVSADVAGYSRLMGEDESGTLASLKAHLRELIDPAIAEYGGRTVKTMGDGLLLEFPSVVDAVRCAVDVQRGMLERNAGVPPESRIQFRIGINVGDILIDGDDIHGDGVNVAARLEGLAQPGEICVSRVVRDQVLDKLGFTFDELGAKQVKNIARPVDVYRIDLVDSPSRRRGSRRERGPAFLAAVGVLAVVAVGAGFAYWSAHRADNRVTARGPAAAPPLSIVVLPFANLTGDAGQDYFAEGLTATLTSEVAQIEDAVVVDSATAQSYKGKSLTAQQIGDALGVRYILQGNVQRSGNRVRVSAQLADALSNAQLWSDSFEGEDADLFALQDRITARIANTMGREVVNVAARKSASQQGDPTVIDLLLRARATGGKTRSLAMFQEMEGLYRKALALQPGHPKATMELATVLAFQASGYGESMSADARERIWREALELAEKAHVADPGDADYFRVVAFHARAHGDPTAERRAAEELVRLRPKWAYPYNVLGSTYMRDGEFDKAVEVMSRAVDLTPRIDASSYVFPQNLCAAQFGAGNNKAAIEWCGKVAAAVPTSSRTRILLAMAYALDGDTARARAEAAEFRRLAPDQKLDADTLRAEARTPARRAYVDDKVIPALRKAGLLD
jgi:class 3 adenylate cyclase/TolB-like protein/cytochrome c-type biogenesis protein CcmH/NrfG